MCDRIIMPDGTEIDEINEFLGTVGPNLRCLCSFSQDAILRFIVNHLPEKLEIDQRLVIERDPFGYIVKVESACGPEVRILMGKVKCIEHDAVFITKGGKSYCPMCFPGGPEPAADKSGAVPSEHYTDQAKRQQRDSRPARPEWLWDDWAAELVRMTAEPEWSELIEKIMEIKRYIEHLEGPGGPAPAPATKGNEK